MFCHSCGQKLPDDARFCSKCGTAVAVESAEEETVDLSISEKDREGVYSRLAEVTLDSMDNTTITLEESQDIADFVLDRLDAVKTEPQLLAFILELSNRWEIYNPVCRTIIQEIQVRIYQKDPEMFTRARRKRAEKRSFIDQPGKPKGRVT